MTEFQLAMLASVSAPNAGNLNDLTCTDMTNETWTRELIEDPNNTVTISELTE